MRAVPDDDRLTADGGLVEKLGRARDDAETLQMNELAFWNDLAGPDNREVEAAALADILTKLFTNPLGARYENGQNYASAVVAMTVILTDAKKTVCELAAVIDELHNFTTER